MTTPTNPSSDPVEELLAELREGSEGKFMGTRLTPDGKETVEMIPIEWAVEVIRAREAKINRLLVHARIEEITNIVANNKTINEDQLLVNLAWLDKRVISLADPNQLNEDD